MLTEQRRQLLLSRLQRDGRLIAKEVSVEFELSEDTIRRDLRELAAEGLLQRVHGGALPSSPTVAPVNVRRDLSLAEKSQLAKAGAKLVEAGQSVFIDGGTTHIELVRHVPSTLKFKVVTHSPAIAVALENHTADVTLIGGTLFRHSMVNVGSQALEQIMRQRCDLAFIGLTGVHAVEGCTTGDEEEAAIKRGIIARAGETVCLLTKHKINAVSPYTVCKLSDLAMLITSQDADTRRLMSSGVQIVSATYPLSATLSES